MHLVSSSMEYCEPNPVTASVVQRMFEIDQAGKGILDITRTLNTEGIAKPTGRLWSTTSVHNILCSEVYIKHNDLG